MLSHLLRLLRAPDDPPGGAPTPPPTDPSTPPTNELTEPPYFQQFPMAFRQSPEAKQFYGLKTQGEFLTAFLGAHQKLARSVVLPDTKNPDPVELATFRTFMGVVEKPSDYGLDPAPYKDSVPDADKTAAFFQDLFHKTNLSKTQAKALFTSFMDGQKATVAKRAEAETARATAFNAKLLEMGAGDPEKAKQADEFFRSTIAQRFGSQSFVKKLAASGLLEDPDTLEQFTAIGRLLADDHFNSGNHGGGHDEPKKIGTMDNYSPDWQAAQAGLRGKAGT